MVWQRCLGQLCEAAIRIDEEVKKLVTDAHDRTTAILTENLQSLHRLANSLLEWEVLTGDEIDMVIRGEELAKPGSWPEVEVTGPAKEPSPEAADPGAQDGEAHEEREGRDEAPETD